MPLTHRAFKDAIYEQVSRLGRALASPKRLELLDLLSQVPRTVEELAGLAGLSIANASQHLRVLRAARLVDASRYGLYVEYRLAGEDVGELFLSVRTLAESRIAEVQQITQAYFNEREEMEAVAGEELRRRARDGEVTVLDVRPREEYRAGHIPGARSIPVGELDARLAELPKDREIVAYCRGPYCVMAVEAVDLLRKNGFSAYRLEEGVVDWRARGLRIDVEEGAHS